MMKLVLVTFDIDSLKAETGAYTKAYEILHEFGMKVLVSNHRNSLIALPNTTVIGECTTTDPVTVAGVRDQLIGEFQKAGIPITHFLVAFLETYAGIGEPVVTA